ncbi:hypothetical protein ACIBHX_16235 [Nonomuraea sp. NPDC050536]|uniref:hypothetical protein n=1 Tax=Nonomuraea sp. NPDC050536 TaxID=3364366 RepID=UPI0037C6CA38
MKRLLIPLTIAGLSAAALTLPAQADPTDPLTPKAADAYRAASFWLDANGAALKKATEYHWDLKQVPKLIQAKTTPDGKPGETAPITPQAPKHAQNINLPITLGKMFFLDREGNYRWCSASSIQARNRNLVATAAHCVYEGADRTYAKWVFVPGYYQGKANWGVYVGAYAFSGDADVAFVAVHNGFAFNGEKQVSFEEFKNWQGDKWVKPREIAPKDCLLKLGQCWSEGSSKELVGPSFPNAALERSEVTEQVYGAAKPGKGNGFKLGEPIPTPVTKSQWDAYKGPGKKSVDAAGNYLITHFYTQKWVKPGLDRKFYVAEFIIGLAKDTGRLGDAVGGQGVSWNQPMGSPVMAFGYPADPQPDGDKQFTGLTPKWCSGKTGTKMYQVNTFRAETHQILKCSMTGGADGGPWIAKYDNNKRSGFVNGVTSLIQDTDNNGRIDTISTAYFDGEIAGIYNKATSAATNPVVSPKGELMQ